MTDRTIVMHMNISFTIEVDGLLDKNQIE